MLLDLIINSLVQDAARLELSDLQLLHYLFLNVPLQLRFEHALLLALD